MITDELADRTVLNLGSGKKYDPRAVNLALWALCEVAVAADIHQQLGSL